MKIVYSCLKFWRLVGNKMKDMRWMFQQRSMLSLKFTGWSPTGNMNAAVGKPNVNKFSVKERPRIQKGKLLYRPTYVQAKLYEICKPALFLVYVFLRDFLSVQKPKFLNDPIENVVSFYEKGSCFFNMLWKFQFL